MALNVVNERIDQLDALRREGRKKANDSLISRVRGRGKRGGDARETWISMRTAVLFHNQGSALARA